MVPLIVPVNVIAADALLLHMDWFKTLFTAGVGFTMILKLPAVPVQALASGVTVMIPVSGILLVLVAVKLAILPVPVAAMPIAGRLLLQL